MFPVVADEIWLREGKCAFLRPSRWFTIRPMHTALTVFLSHRPTGCWQFTFQVKGQSLEGLVWSHKDTETPARVSRDITRTAVPISPAGVSLFPIAWWGSISSPRHSASCKRHVFLENRYQWAAPITDSNNKQMSPFSVKGERGTLPPSWC